MPVARTPETVHLWGGSLCLDYANSVDWSSQDAHADPEDTDVLRTPEMLTDWGRRVELLGDDARPASAAELDRARELRDSVHRLYASIGRGEKPSQDDVDVLMGSYTEAVERASLVEADDAYELDWLAWDPRRLRYAVAADAVGLLRDAERLKRVRRCPGRNCGWLFLDTSGRRRWCSMSTCGSREKMRRLHRRRAGGGGQPLS